MSTNLPYIQSPFPVYPHIAIPLQTFTFPLVTFSFCLKDFDVSVIYELFQFQYTKRSLFFEHKKNMKEEFPPQTSGACSPAALSSLHSACKCWLPRCPVLALQLGASAELRAVPSPHRTSWGLSQAVSGTSPRLHFTCSPFLKNHCPFA